MEPTRYWDAGEGTMRLSVGGTWGTQDTYDGAFTGTDLDVGRAATYAGGVREINGYTGTYSALQTLIEGLMVANGVLTDESDNLITDESGVYITWW